MKLLQWKRVAGERFLILFVKDDVTHGQWVRYNNHPIHGANPNFKDTVVRDSQGGNIASKGFRMAAKLLELGYTYQQSDKEDGSENDD